MTLADERLREAIEGERRDWHEVSVRPDDIADVLAENARLRAALEQVAEAGHATGQIGGPHRIDGFTDWLNCDARGCRIARAALRGPSTGPTSPAFRIASPQEVHRDG